VLINIHIAVFDVPSMNAPFEERLQRLQQLIGVDSKYVRVVQHEKCRGNVEL
jgi:hypothetical protein